MLKKQKAAYVMLTIFLISLFAGAVYTIISGDKEMMVSGKLDLTIFPQVLEEPPYPLTFIVIERETNKVFYLAYQNQTLTNPKDPELLNLYMQNVVIRGKQRCMRNIDKTEEYSVLIVLEIKKI